MKDRKIDAFLWSGGVPTAAVMDLAATPGGKLRLLDHGEAVDGMNRKHGPLYFKGQIPARVYQGVDKPVSSAMVWNLLVANASMPDDVAYAVVKTLTERKAELTAVHKEAEQIAFDTQGAGASAIPFHPGALRYFKEKGIKVQ
jgi:TRAP transporter TAXI family solute receptor